MFSGLFKRKQRFTLEYLKFLYRTLETHPYINPGNEGTIIKTLKDVAEHMIWGDRHDHRFVLFVAEKNFLAFVLRLLRQHYSRNITVQLLQTLSIMVQNMEEEYGLYYLFSQNHINDIIVHKFDFSQPEVLNYYVTFMKTLSMKLNNDMIHFFFNAEAGTFPLYIEASKLYAHQETLVRTTVRALTLNIYRIDDPDLRKYILSGSVENMFQLVLFIREQCLDLWKMVRTVSGKEKQAVLTDGVENQKDHYFYLEDILQLEFPGLNATLSDQFLANFLLPVLVRSILNESEPSPDEDLISCKLALFLLSQVCDIFQDSMLVNSLVMCLFHPKPPKLADELVRNPVKAPVRISTSVAEVLWNENALEGKLTAPLTFSNTFQNKPQKLLAPTSTSQPDSSAANFSEYKPYPVKAYPSHSKGSRDKVPSFNSSNESFEKYSPPVTPNTWTPMSSKMLVKDEPIEDYFSPRISASSNSPETGGAQWYGKRYENANLTTQKSFSRALNETKGAGVSEAVSWLESNTNMVSGKNQKVLKSNGKRKAMRELVNPELYHPLQCNRIRNKIIGFLNNEDEQLISSSASLILKVIRNPKVSHPLLKAIELKPQSWGNVHKLRPLQSTTTHSVAGMPRQTKDTFSISRYSSIVDVCLKTLLKLPKLSIFSIRVLAELITDLALVNSSLSTNSELDYSRGLSEEHYKTLEMIHEKAIISLRGLLPLPAELESYFLDTFYEEWRAFHRESDIKYLIDNSIRILPSWAYANRKDPDSNKHPDRNWHSNNEKKTENNTETTVKKIRHRLKSEVSSKVLERNEIQIKRKTASGLNVRASKSNLVDHSRLLKIIDQLRKNVQVLLQIGKLREKFTGKSHSLPFQLQRNWKYFRSQRLRLEEVAAGSLPMLVIENSKTKEPMMIFLRDPDYVLLWRPDNETKTLTGEIEDAVIQFAFPVAYTQAFLHHSDKRVVQLTMKHHYKPHESCTLLSGHKSKWMLTLYFNTGLKDVIRTRSEAEADAKRVTSVITENRSRKREEIDLAVRKLLEGDPPKEPTVSDRLDSTLHPKEFKATRLSEVLAPPAASVKTTSPSTQTQTSISGTPLSENSTSDIRTDVGSVDGATAKLKQCMVGDDSKVGQSSEVVVTTVSLGDYGSRITDL